MSRDDKYFTQFDGVTIGEKRYALGDQIEAGTHPAVLQILIDQGQIASNEPSRAAATIPADADVANMNRVELEGAARSVFDAQLANMTDDDLRSGIERHNAAQGAGPGGDGSTGGTPYADLKDKPLGSLKTADLDTIAREEGVSFDGANTNADRVKAIEAKRAKA